MVWCIALATLVASLPTNGYVTDTRHAVSEDDPVFADDEMKHIFGVDREEDVPEYELIKLGEVSRDTKKRINAFNNEMYIKPQPKKDFAPHIAEHYDENGKISKHTDHARDHIIGTVNDEEDSHFALTKHDGGFSGHLQDSSNLYIVHPLPARMQSDAADHVIYRKKSDISHDPLRNIKSSFKAKFANHDVRKDDAREYQQDDGVDIGESPQDEQFDVREFQQDELFDVGESPEDEQFDVGESPEDEQFDVGESPVDEQFDVGESPEDEQLDVEESPQDEQFDVGEAVEDEHLESEHLLKDLMEHEHHPKTVELLVALDSSMIDFYTENVLHGYVNAIESGICDFFQSDSLAYPIKVVVVRKVFFHTDKFKATNLTDLKSKFVAWFSKEENNPANDTNTTHADIGMLLTRKGYAGDKDKKAGLANSDLCGRGAACVVDDYGFMSTVTAVHEIAHTMGVKHDEDYPKCKHLGRTYFMSGVNVPSKPMKWSACTSKVLHDKLHTPASKCFNDERAHNLSFAGVSHKLSHKSPFYGSLYDRDQQCKALYSEHYRGCHLNEYKARCDNLYCTSGTGCSSRVVPPMDGTTCGPGMWCVASQCVAAGKYKAPVDGGWTTWSDYVSCRAECGVGEQWKERTCTNPRPENGGRECLGKRQGHLKTCESGLVCDKKRLHTRKALCKQRNPSYNEITWVKGGKNVCRLYCRKKNNKRKKVYKSEGIVPDGFRCNPYDMTKKDLCMAGECKVVGCDDQLDSDAVLDRCGKCNGDGSTCKEVRGKKAKAKAGKRVRYITTIPAGARFIHVREAKRNKGSTLFSLKGGKRKRVRGIPGRYVKKLRRNTGHKIYIALANKQISIYYYTKKKKNGFSIKWSYAAKATKQSSTLKWKALVWSRCNRTCGGGSKTRKLLCIRKDDKSPVGKHFCGHTKPTTTSQCNDKIACKPKWEATWYPCTKTCGKGTATEQLNCTVFADGKQKQLPDGKCGKKPDPHTKPCNEIMCAAQWYITNDFGECKGKCGKTGVSGREVLCQHILESGVKKTTDSTECKAKKKPKDVRSCKPAC